MWCGRSCAGPSGGSSRAGSACGVDARDDVATGRVGRLAFRPRGVYQQRGETPPHSPPPVPKSATSCLSWGLVCGGKGLGCGMVCVAWKVTPGTIDAWRGWKKIPRIQGKFPLCFRERARPCRVWKSGGRAHPPPPPCGFMFTRHLEALPRQSSERRGRRATPAGLLASATPPTWPASATPPVGQDQGRARDDLGRL